MKYLVCFFTAFMMSACTYNVSMAHTEGTATDVVDSNQSAEGEVSPNLELPGVM